MRRARPALIPPSFWALLLLMGLILFAVSRQPSSPPPQVIYCDPELVGEEPDGYGTRYTCVNHPGLVISLAH